MSARVISHKTSNLKLIVTNSVTDDGGVYSLIFDNAAVTSAPDDKSEQPEHLSFDLTLAFTDAQGAEVEIQTQWGWAAVALQDWAVGIMRANGVRAVYQNGDNATTYETLRAVVNENNEVSISIGLWAQRELSQKNSSAQVCLNSLDIRLI